MAIGYQRRDPVDFDWSAVAKRVRFEVRLWADGVVDDLLADVSQEYLSAMREHRPFKFSVTSDDMFKLMLDKRAIDVA